MLKVSGWNIGAIKRAPEPLPIKIAREMQLSRCRCRGPFCPSLFFGVNLSTYCIPSEKDYERISSSTSFNLFSQPLSLSSPVTPAGTRSSSSRSPKPQAASPRALGFPLICPLTFVSPLPPGAESLQRLSLHHRRCGFL